MTKAEKIAQFDPNGLAIHEGVYGMPFTAEESEIIIIPVPWEVTVSFGTGTVDGPACLREAADQVDLYVPGKADFWQKGIFMLPEPENIRVIGQRARKLAAESIEKQGEGVSLAELQDSQTAVDLECEKMIEWVQAETKKWLDAGKKVALVGGDHSTPLGFVKALAKKNESFGILQIDAHADLRKAYEGFRYSHASIAYNMLAIKEVEKIVQVGIRDYCQEEVELAESNADRIKIFFDDEIKSRQFCGENWDQICTEIVESLPQHVYISFDIDGLNPQYCPNTGTPVAGGFSPEETLYLIKKLVKSGRKVIGFDLNEVGKDENNWDGNVAARLLYHVLACIY